MDASCIHEPSIPATCAGEIAFLKNRDFIPSRKEKIGRFALLHKKIRRRQRACAGYANTVRPRPVVKITLFFLLHGTGWLTYWSRKFAFAVIQPFSLVAMPAVKFTR